MARTREPLPHLNIPQQMNMPRPGDLQGQPMFSPALHGFHPVFPIPNAMQTPMQPFFNSQPPPAPGRPIHHSARASIAHFAPAGMQPPNSFPITPLAGHFSRPSMMGMPGPPSVHPLSNRNRRQLSIGGPPKAILGGPQRRLSPLPIATPSPVPQKTKKINVNIPKETVLGKEGDPPMRTSWARNVLDDFVFKDQQVASVQSTSAEVYPPDEERKQLPVALDVFLPGKRAWDEMKRKSIEEKLEKLGVERSLGSIVPYIHAPHARAASISSPADPQVLLYKLNKLQQSQEGTASVHNSLTTSPQPPYGVMSSSPHRPPPRFITNRHGHTMSLAHPPLHSFDGGSEGFDPFGPNVELAVGPIPHSSQNAHNQEDIRAPQGRVPITMSSLVVPQVTSRPGSRPDFVRGFGLDVTEEEEEEEEENVEHVEVIQNREECIPVEEQAHESREQSLHNMDGTTTVSQSRLHSRHVSKVSTALSTRSAGALEEEEFVGEEDMSPPTIIEPPVGDEQEDVNLDEAVGEWTGSEDFYFDETSEGEDSIGEWSNPSDEERARKERLERRSRRRAPQQVDVPRRLPNFPRPPENIAMNMPMPIHVDDDIISNPSEEGHHVAQGHGEYINADYYSRPPSNLGGASGPLPLLAHSRVSSAQHTVYDPAHAHSRAPSDQYINPDNEPRPQPQLSSQPPRRDSLNPFAKPFVFGIGRSSGSWSQGSAELAPPNAPMLGHTRLPSLGKPLNVAAPEFKPGGFTFRPPLGVPSMPAPPLEPSRPLPEVPHEESPFKVQGREKRQRRESNSSVEEGDSMMSFRFPASLDSPKSLRRISATLSHKLDASAEPFTFAGFSAVANIPHVPRESDIVPETVVDDTSAPLLKEVGASFGETFNDDGAGVAGDGEGQVDQSTLPTGKFKRAPIPLDFKHPVTKNTVPAGLFKALVNNGEDRTRRSVRSRLSSREIFEHGRRPSMDDANIAPIALHNNRSRSRLVTDPGNATHLPSDDVFGTTMNHIRRRSSFADVTRPQLASPDERPESANSEMSLTGRLEARHSENRIEAMLEEAFATLLQNIKRESTQQHSATQAMVSEMQSLFRTQLRDSATHSLDTLELTRRGEFDFQLLKGLFDESNRELAEALRTGFHQLEQHVWQIHSDSVRPEEIVPAVERLSNQTMSAIIEAISALFAQQDSIYRSVPARERDAIVENLMSVLTPVIASIRSEPIDYNFLTSELTQAVKPHISQLIDLASDKQETAGLIIDRLIPLLPSQNIDIDVVTQQLIQEVRRAIAPIDAFEIKEQVADLVVERLDSRLAVRDKAFNVDSLAGKINDGITLTAEPFKSIPASLELLHASQASLTSRQDSFSAHQAHVASLVSEFPSTINEGLRELKSIHTEILLKLEQSLTTTGSDDVIAAIKTTVEAISTAQQNIVTQAQDLQLTHQTILEKVIALPETIQTATDALKNNHTEFLSSHESLKRELDELRKANTDHQVSLTKARSAHGQVRVEKDALSEKLALAEGDRDRLRNQAKELQTANTEKVTQTATLENKNRELEDALAKALARLQDADVVTQANQKRISELETNNRQLVADKQTSKAKIDALDLQITFVTRDKESATQALEVLRQQYDQLLAQQSHWDDLGHALEKIDLLTALVGQADNEEVKDLRRYRDRTKVLEGEHAALQKRFKEQESKINNSERAALTARQSLAQAQQRSSEWERRAKEFEGQLEMTQTKLDQAEQTRAQVDADYSLVKLELEERDANNRLSKDQQKKLKEQIILLEDKCTRLQLELEKAKATVANTPQSGYRNITNGNVHALPRPDSRASSIYDKRSATPQQPRLQSQASTMRSDTPPQASVWDSMHAPTTDPSNQYNTYASSNMYAPHGRYPNLGPSTPKARHPQSQVYRPVVASPTPSTVSLTPTQGDDGWWS